MCVCVCVCGGGLFVRFFVVVVVVVVWEVCCLLLLFFIGLLKTHFWLEAVTRCEPSIYQPIS